MLLVSELAWAVFHHAVVCSRHTPILNIPTKKLAQRNQVGLWLDSNPGRMSWQLNVTHLRKKIKRGRPFHHVASMLA